MTQEQLLDIDQVDTFDILLFKTKGMAPKVTRWWTGNEFGKSFAF